VGSVWAAIKGEEEVNKTMQLLDGVRYGTEYNATIAGSYNVVIYANDSVGNINNSTSYVFEVYGNTTGWLEQNRTINISDINQTNNVTFTLVLTFYNTGNTTAYSVNLSIVTNSSWTVSSVLEECGSVEKQENCSKEFNITIPAGTSAGTYYINSTAIWKNPDSSLDNITNQTQVNVLSNPLLEVIETTIIGTVNHSTEKTVGTFNVNSTGNDILTNITFNCSNGNLDSSWVIFYPSNISQLQAGDNQTIIVNVSIPAGQAPGNYSCEINVSAINDGSDIVNLTVEVPKDESWIRSPATCSKAVTANKTGTICTVTIQNTGNVMLNFTITPTVLINYTQPSETYFEIPAQGFDSFDINYNTSGASIGEEKVTLYNITSNSTSLLSQEVEVTISIISTPWWNSFWLYRKPILLSESEGIERRNIVVEANITTEGHINNCSKEIRVISTETGENIEIPVNIVDGDDATWCMIRFKANVSANAVNEKNYYVYYGNPQATFPAYPEITTNKTYNFISGAGADKWAYEYDSSTSTPPSSGPTITGETEFTSYTDIEALDASRYDTSHKRSEGATHHFKFTIYEGYGGITNLSFKWIGYDTATTSNLFVWNYSSSSWLSVGSGASTTDDNTIEYSVTSGFNEFIDPDGILHLLAENSIGAGGASVIFYTNYIEIFIDKIYKNYNIGSEEKLILPNVTSIAIYDVHNTTDTHTGGKLVKSGLNLTFNLLENGVYRVEINVTGNASWDISHNTIVYHDGLDSGWLIDEVNDIWYSNGTGNFTGGTFSQGKVEWNTELGGHISKEGIITFAYIINLTNTNSIEKSIHFFINETDYTRADGLSWTEDYSSYNLTKMWIHLDFPFNGQNLSYLNVTFNFTVFNTNPDTIIQTCELWGNWSGGWHLNQSLISPIVGKTINFSTVNLYDGYYIWNVMCNDTYNNRIWNSTNFSFAAFLFPEAPHPDTFNSSLDAKEWQGNVTIIWSKAAHSDYYKIYYTNDLKTNFSLLNITRNTNYTDITAKNVRKRFYKVATWNPIGENMSNVIIGKQDYLLERKDGSTTKNWIGFPLNASYLEKANDTLYDITNATSVTMWNATLQQAVFCNFFTCPESEECTNNTCNFFIRPGYGYEININDSAGTKVNWSMTGIVYGKVNITLRINTTSFHKNWIAMYANTTLVNASDLLTSISTADAVTMWNATSQTSIGLIPSPFPWISYLGTNFIIKPELGYEVSVTQPTNWTQV